MAAKRKAAAISGAAEDEDPIDPSDELTFTGLGGCQEVGRSCHILQYKGKTVMVRAAEQASGQSANTMLARRWHAYRQGGYGRNALLRRL